MIDLIQQGLLASHFLTSTRWECTLAAVWGQMSTGGGHSQLEEMIECCGGPSDDKEQLH